MRVGTAVMAARTEAGRVWPNRGEPPDGAGWGERKGRIAGGRAGMGIEYMTRGQKARLRVCRRY